MELEIYVAAGTAVLTSIVGPIVVHYVQSKYNKKNIDHVKESLETNVLVFNKLEEIKTKLNTDRVWLMQFHNGGHFYPTGKSIQKFSMCYETVEPGTSSIQGSFQNIPISLFSKAINFLLENNVISIPDYKDETVATHGLKHIAEETGCRSAYMFAIKSIDNKFVGILGIDYTKRKTQLEEHSLNELLVEASAIGGVLMNHLNSKS